MKKPPAIGGTPATPKPTTETIHDEAMDSKGYDATYELAMRLARTLRILSVGGFVTEEKIKQAFEIVK